LGGLAIIGTILIVLKKMGILKGLLMKTPSNPRHKLVPLTPTTVNEPTEV